MAALIEKEQLDVDGQLVKHHGSQRQPKRKVKSKHASTTANDVEDEDDGNFSASDSEDTSSTSSESDDPDSVMTRIPNDEVR